MIGIEELQSFLEERFRGGSVRVGDMTGTGDHMEIEVVSTQFRGKSRLERHRMMHQIVQEAPGAKDIHAVKFKTSTPDELKDA